MESHRFEADRTEESTKMSVILFVQKNIEAFGCVADVETFPKQEMAADSIAGLRRSFRFERVTAEVLLAEEECDDRK